MPRSDAANRDLRDARREQIIGIAAVVFARQGLAGTKIGDIAAAAEMSQGLLYRYFASKEEVFAAVVRMLDAAGVELCDRATLLSGTARERLRWLTDQVLRVQYGMPAFALVIAHALTNTAVPAEVRAIALHETEALRAAFGAIICEGQRCGDVIAGNPDQLAMLYLGALHGLAVGAPLFCRAEIGFPDAETMMLLLTDRKCSDADL